MNLRIWITRSEPGASRQAEVLRAAGYDVVTAPLIAVEATAAAAPTGPFQHVVFLSEQAVRHGGDLGYCHGATVHAVGPATARALAEVGIRAEVPDVASSEGLLARFETLPVDGAPILVVAGEDGRKDLRDVLTARGARVREHLCYRRLPASSGVPNVATIDAVLVSSQDGFRALARLWFDSGGAPDVLVIVASSRIAGLAPELGFHNVRVADGPVAEDWLKALEKQAAERRGSR